MLRAVRVGGQTSHPWTLILHHQMARRCLARDTAAPSVPTVKGLMHSVQGTSSSEMPWTANWSQRVVLQVGSTVSRVSPSLPMSICYSVFCPGHPLEDSSWPGPDICCRHPPTTLRSGPVYARFENHPPMHRPCPGRPRLSPHQTDWNGHRRGY